MTELHTPHKPETSSGSKSSGSSERSGGGKSGSSAARNASRREDKREDKKDVVVKQPHQDTQSEAVVSQIYVVPESPKVVEVPADLLVSVVPPNEPEPAPSRPARSAGSSSSRRSENRSSPAGPPKTAQTTTDLRAVLAKIAASSSSETSAVSREGSSSASTKRGGNVADGPSLKAALASALKTVPEAPSSKIQTPPSPEKRTPSPEFNATAQMTALADEAEAAFAALERSIEKSTAPLPAPDPKELAKILKASPGGRSPFK